MDFRFNLLRNVKKVSWKKNQPWYREVRNGLNWFGYCYNANCVSYKMLFVNNRGYGIFKLENEHHNFSCPVCLQFHVEICNIGFVSCEWAIQGQLKSDETIKIVSDGQTFDD